MNKLIKYLWEHKKEIILMEDLMDAAKIFYFNYENIVNYLIKKREIIKIYGNLYYVKKPDEINQEYLIKKDKALKLLSKALEFENEKKWYFGLYTALKYHNISFKKNPNDYLLTSRTFFKKRKITLLGRNINALVFNPKLFDFGIIENGIKYSDLEKTFLDFIYLWKYKQIPNYKLRSILEKYRDIYSQKKMIDYLIYYPSEVKHVINEFYEIKN